MEFKVGNIYLTNNKGECKNQVVICTHIQDDLALCAPVEKLNTIPGIINWVAVDSDHNVWWYSANEIEKCLNEPTPSKPSTDDFMRVKGDLVSSFMNLMDSFHVHGDDGVCISDIEDALVNLKGIIVGLEDML